MYQANMHKHIIFPFILGIRNTHTYIRSRPAHPQQDAPGGFFTGEDSLSHGDYSHAGITPTQWFPGAWR